MLGGPDLLQRGQLLVVVVLGGPLPHVVRDAVLHYLEVYRTHAPLFRAWWEVLEPHSESGQVGTRLLVNVVTPNDFQATVFHLLGLDHEKLVYHHGGRAQRLTDGRPARVVKEILA